MIDHGAGDAMETELRQRVPDSSAEPEQIPSVSASQSEDEEPLMTEKEMENRTASLAQASTGLDVYAEKLLSGVPARWRNWVIRGIFSIFMISSFCFIIYKGPLWLMFMVFAIQIKCFQEIIAIGYAVYRMHNLPWFRVLSWWFLITTDYFLFSEALIDYFRILLKKEEFLQFLVNYRQIITFAMYIVGFVGFVLSLKKRYYLRQFSLFAWTHVTLVILVAQSFFIVQNIFQGIIWFLVPVSLIICNDIMAYMFGFFFGRTPLIKLSPKKTWEGFIGGAVSTLLFGMLFGYWLLHYEWFVCPIEYVESGDFTDECVIPPSFRVREYNLPLFLAFIGKLFRIPRRIVFYPFVFHCFIMALFASIIGPFGGFFASGFKRAFKIKDFGDVIPGHGGLMDRFDCQLLMNTFVQVYIASFIRIPNPTKIVQQVEFLRVESQLEVFHLLQQSLQERGLIT